ncbi:MAG: PilZ domain-containing protein [Nitrospiria bacterium]
MQERRENPRSTFHLRTEVLLNGGREQISLLRANIGFGGIGGYTRDLVEAGSDAQVKIHFARREGGEAVETVEGKVIWQKQDGNFTALGLAFSQLERDIHPQLFSYLQYAEQFD